MRSALLLLFVLFFGVNNSNAQLDAFIENEMAIRNIPGLSAVVVKNQSIVWQGHYGLANVENNTLVTSNTLFTVASISKLFVGTAVMQLVENGMIDLDIDINQYLDFEVKHPHFENIGITTRMLLQHRSGIRDPEGDMYNYWETGDHSSDLDAFLKSILRPESPDFQAQYWSGSHAPNSSIWYSNVGFSLLGLIVEQQTNMPFYTYCKSNIFEPLCMENTTFFWSDISEENRAMPYRWQNGQHQATDYYSIALYPSALIKSTAAELAHFLLAYTGRGTINGLELLSASSVDLLTPMNFNQDNLAWWNGTSWTFTFHFPDDEVWFHGGYMPGIRARMNYYPADGTGIIILTNGEGQYGFIEEKLADEILNFVSGEALELDCTTSVQEIKPQNAIVLYPSISEGTFYLKNTSFGKLSLWTTKGESIPFEKQDNKIIVNTAYSGMLLAHFIDYTGIIYYQKIILQ